MDVRRHVHGLARAGPGIEMVLGEGEAGHLEEARPADALDPLAHALPRAAILLVGVEDLLDDLLDLRPARRIVGQVGDDQLVERRLRARVGMLAADPDRRAWSNPAPLICIGGQGG